MFTKEYEEICRQHEDNILKTGLSLLSVFEGDGNPTFIYTLGLTDLGYPEIICLGVDPVICGGVINHVVASYFLADLVPKRGDMIGGILTDDAYLRLGSVDRRWCTENYLIQASDRQERLGRRPITAVQLVFPDREGFFPDESGFMEVARHYSPCLAPGGKWDFRQDERIVSCTTADPQLYFDKLKRKRMN